jgi:valyl-tRNA synthetase
VRYWAASARLGTDTAFDDKVFKVGKRLATKLFNAGKFVLQQEGDTAPIDHELDRAFVARLCALVERVTRLYEEFEYAHALQETETFFWRDFTDTYLELVKVRVRDVAGGGSARAALRLGLNVLLRLFAPVLPYITEEVWSWAFAEETDRASIHAASWPAAADFAAIAAPADATVFDAAVACLAAINKAKSEGGVSVGRGVRKLRLRASEPTVARLQPAAGDVMASARVEEHVVEAAAGPVDDEFLVTGIEFVEQAETS